MQTQQGSSVDLGVLRVIGRNHHVEFTLDERPPFHVLEVGLRSYLTTVEPRFEGGEVTLNLGDRMLDTQQVDSLRHILEDEYGLRLLGISCGVAALRHLLTQDAPSHEVSSSREIAPLASARAPSITPASPHGRSTPENPASSGGQETLLVKGNCRSGTTIFNSGNIVVAGDVHPGAEITASKDIMVFGKLGGIAHAGVGGGDGAVVVALQIEAPQLRIGPHIRMDLRSEYKRRGGMAEVALVRNEAIVVEPYPPR